MGVEATVRALRLPDSCTCSPLVFGDAVRLSRLLVLLGASTWASWAMASHLMGIEMTVSALRASRH